MPLLLERSNGTRGWEMRWDPQGEQWAAQNRGSSLDTGGLPARGEPGSFGYDELGNRKPCANQRPRLPTRLVQAVWDRAVAASPDGVVRVLDYLDNLIEIHWQPGQSRAGLWDMGHIPRAPYARLQYQYLNHEISLEQFRTEYFRVENYRVEHWLRNRSHMDE